MSKKLLSLALSLIMCFTLSVPAFAATGVSLRDSRHRTVVVTDPNWSYQSTMTITKEDAKNIKTAEAVILAGLGGIIAKGAELGAFKAESITAAGMASIWAVSGTPDDEGVYTFETKYRTTYSEDLLSGARHVQREEILFRITFTGGGETSVKETSYTLR